jgi:hypothetical protein
MKTICCIEHLIEMVLSSQHAQKICYLHERYASQAIMRLLSDGVTCNMTSWLSLRL